MSHDQQREPEDAEERREDAANQPTILRILERRIGAPTQVSLHEQGSDGASTPIIDPHSEEKQALPRGRGNYHFSGEIARGGMGVVLKGHDEDLGRDIAVKVLHKDLAERTEALQRFVEEAQIGGQLQHPGIVPVYELGLMADERPYFTMKLVKGRTLASHLEERKSPATDRRRMLEIFESVCQTMAYAHSRGVIHRDLKPANVMLGAFGEVQVVDWGLAKVLSRGGTADERKAREAHSVRTVLETVRSDGSASDTDSIIGSVMGTPAYMPPEQAGGLVDQLDERSDVYSLGAILCELLTGAPPHVGKQEEVLVAAARGRTEDAYARLDACGADPELVELTKECLLAAPAARPRHAGVVASRVHDHVVSVEERAHAARVDAAVQRRARKLTLALAATVLLAGLGGGVAWTSVQSERSARELADATRQRELAEDVNQALAEAALLHGRSRWAEARVAGERARALASAGDAAPALHARVDEVLAAIEQGQATQVEREARERDTAALLAELAEIRFPDGVIDWAEAAKTYAAPFEHHGLDLDARYVESVAEEFRERGLGADVALVLDSWTRARRRAGDEEGALRLLEVAHLIDDDPVRADLREAIANEDADMLLSLAESSIDEQPPATLNLLATALGRMDQREAALRVFDVALLHHPDSFQLQAGAANLLRNGSFAEMERAVECYSAAAALQPDAVEVRHRLGYVLNDLGRYDQAARAFESALLRKPGDGLLLYRLAWSRLALGDHDRALSNFERSLETARGNWWEATLNQYYGRALRELGELERALPHSERATRLRPNTSQFWNELGFTRQAMGDLEGAEEAHRRGVRAAPDEAWTHAHLARVRRLRGDLDGAEVSLAHADEASPGSWVAELHRGLLKRDRGDAEGAIANLRRAIELVDEHPDPYVSLAFLLATCEPEALRDPPEAVRLAERAVSFDSRYGYPLAALGVARYRAGDFAGALDALERWAASRSFHRMGRLHEQHVVAKTHLAMALGRAGRKDEGRRALEEVRVERSPLSGNAHVDGRVTEFVREAEELLN
jgi:serine/threonine-protein kinase